MSPLQGWPSTPPAVDAVPVAGPDGSLRWIPLATFERTGVQDPPVVSTPADPQLSVKVVDVTANSASVTWGPVGTDDTYGRDGTDRSGSPAWTSPTGARSPQPLTQLRASTTYTATVTSGGKTATQRFTTLADPGSGTPTTPPATTPPATTTPTTPPTTTPGTPATSSRFKAFTLGASVNDAADGDFNRWLGKKHGLYVTWADNGKVWAIDTPGSEYGSGKVATLGDFDLAVAPQRRNTSGWAGAAKGDMDATWRADLKELVQKWAGRKGTLYYDPWHELNGNWYGGWTVPKGQEANFRAASKRFRKIWDEIVGTDPRFVLVLVFNRNATTGVRAQDLIEPGVWDALGVDYYDFGMKASAASAAAWAEERQRTENGGSPVGILQWIALAASLGLPLLLQEWGVQYGDNVVFVNGMTAVFAEHGYSGTGPVAGKILGAGWHNLIGKSPDPNAGGNFLITENGKDYPKRAAAARALREWSAKTNWRQA